MNTAKNEIIIVRGIPITTCKRSNEDYISLTDMANSQDGTSRAADVMKNMHGVMEMLLHHPALKGTPPEEGNFESDNLT